MRIIYHVFIVDHPVLFDYVYERNIKSPILSDHLWKYRPAITLEHLAQQIEARELKNDYPALSFFLREVRIVILIF